MNCPEFNSLIYDLADDRAMDAGRRRSALAHALSCQDCAAHLASERRIGAGLRAYGESMDALAAPPRLKESLLAAFAAQQEAQQEGPEAPAAAAPVLAFRASAPRRWARWALAAAAGLLILAAAGSLFWMGGFAGRAPEVANQPDPTPSSKEPKPSPSPEPDKKPAETKKEDAPIAPQIRRALRRPPSYVARNANAEETTAFIPLTYTGGSAAGEGGLIVRVEVPRSTLVALGLPLDPVRGESHVKADLLVGDDGMTRAIRLVQRTEAVVER